MKRRRSKTVLVLLGFMAAAPGLSPVAGAAGVELSTNWAAYVAGDPLVVSAHAAPLPQSFDAWAVILAPDGTMYFMSLAGTIAPGALPLARAVPGLSADANATLLSMRVPAGSPRGDYEAVLVLLPAGTAPASVADAEAKAIPGCFVRTPFYVISGRISIDINGAWDAVLDGLGEGVLTINQPDYLVDGTFSGDLGDATVLGFVDLDAFTLFLDFADAPGRTDMTLRGGESGGGLAGEYASDAFEPASGGWRATARP